VTLIVWHGDRAKRAAHAGSARGLTLAAEHILQVSNSRVPIEEGTLERSGVVDVDEDALLASISYDTPYAVVQHEDMLLQHDSGRSPKFLEQALDEEWKAAQRIIAAEVRKELQ
jgi:hypothetical protein